MKWATAAAVSAMCQAAADEARCQYECQHAAYRAGGQRAAPDPGHILVARRKISHNCVNCGAPHEPVCSYCGTEKCNG